MTSSDASRENTAASVSVIVISYFTGPLLDRCLAALATQRAVHEVLLVDNGNHDGAVSKAIAAYKKNNPDAPPLVLLDGHGNIGFAAACNKAVAKAQGDIVLFLNPDAVLEENVVARLVQDSSDLPSPWILAPKLVGPDGKEQQGSRRAVLTPWRTFVEGTKLYRLAPEHPYFQRFNMHQDAPPDEIKELPTISGACFMTPRADYLSIGGMDERYFLHVEDVDFCLRFTKAGGGVYFDPHIEVVHYKSSSRANAWRIELRKTKSLITYFQTHFARAYPRPFLWLVYTLLWLSLGGLAIRRAIGRTLRIVGLRLRGRNATAARAKSMSKDRAAR